jgi:hypothetical protein
MYLCAEASSAITMVANSGIGPFTKLKFERSEQRKCVTEAFSFCYVSHSSVSVRVS